jgi:hypothetical protein
MTSFYHFAARLCGSLALLCAILAVLASPSQVWADDLSECQTCCETTQPPGTPEELQDCINQCMQGAGPCGYVTTLNCKNDCVCDLSPCGDDICQNVAGCSTSCVCKDKVGGRCECDK